jgi:hypothetical protein
MRMYGRSADGRIGVPAGRMFLKKADTFQCPRLPLAGWAGHDSAETQTEGTTEGSARSGRRHARGPRPCGTPPPFGSGGLQESVNPSLGPQPEAVHGCSQPPSESVDTSEPPPSRPGPWLAAAGRNARSTSPHSRRGDGRSQAPAQLVLRVGSGPRAPALGHIVVAAALAALME